MDEKQKQTIWEIGNLIVETVKAAGSMGMPSGHLYAVMSSAGISIGVYEQLIGVLVELKKLNRKSHLLTVP